MAFCYTYVRSVTLISNWEFHSEIVWVKWDLSCKVHIRYVRHYNPLLIINRSWTLTIHNEKNFWKSLLENKEMGFKNGVKNIQAAGYNGARTVFEKATKNWQNLSWFIGPEFSLYNSGRFLGSSCSFWIHKTSLNFSSFWKILLFFKKLWGTKNLPGLLHLESGPFS